MNRVNIGSYSSKKGWKNPPIEEKPKEKKKKKFGLRKRGVFVVIFVMILSVCGIVFFNQINKIPGVNLPQIQPVKSLCKDILNPECWTDTFKPDLKETDGKTNMLIVGLDTRENDSGLKNTDTIALASFDHETQETMLISIPRDFYSPTYATRINAIYAFTQERNPDDPFASLKDEVSKITGREIHYTTVVRFGAVTDLINEFDGIEICPESPFTAQYPNENPRPGEGQWTYHEFEAGCQMISGERALIYSRFRYVSKGPSSLASDFSRARRQQEVIEGLKNKLTEQNLSLSERASTYWKLVQNFQENVDTDITFQDILGGLSYLNTASKDPLNIVLDPNFGGLNNIIYTDTSTGAYLIRPKDATYGGIHNELNKILSASNIYKENPNIVVRNWGKTYINSASPVQELESELPYKEAYTYRNEFGKADFTGYKVIDFTDGEKSSTLRIIQDKLNILEVSRVEDFDIARSSLNEDFIILVGLPEVTPSPSLR